MIHAAIQTFHKSTRSKVNPLFGRFPEPALVTFAPNFIETIDPESLVLNSSTPTYKILPNPMLTCCLLKSNNQDLIFVLDSELEVRIFSPKKLITVYKCQQELPFGILPKLQQTRVFYSGEIDSETVLVLYDNLMYILINHIEENVQCFTVSEFTQESILPNDILDVSVASDEVRILT